MEDLKLGGEHNMTYLEMRRLLAAGKLVIEPDKKTGLQRCKVKCWRIKKYWYETFISTISSQRSLHASTPSSLDRRVADITALSTTKWVRKFVLWNSITSNATYQGLIWFQWGSPALSVRRSFLQPTSCKNTSRLRDTFPGRSQQKAAARSALFARLSLPQSTCCESTRLTLDIFQGSSKSKKTSV